MRDEVREKGVVSEGRIQTFYSWERKELPCKEARAQQKRRGNGKEGAR